MRGRSIAVSLLLITAAATLDACAPVRPRDGWQGLGRRWFDAEVLTGFDSDGSMVATLSVSIPYRNLVFLRAEEETYRAGYSVDVVQRHRGRSLRINRFKGEIDVASYQESREALVERKTVRLDLVDVEAAGAEPIELLISVQVDKTQRRNRMLLTVTPERMSEGGLALGELTVYQLRNPLRPPPDTTLQIASRAVPDATLFTRASFGGFDVATGPPWILVRIFDLGADQEAGEHQLQLEVAGVDVPDHRWIQSLPVPKQGTETAVLFQLPADALGHGANRLAVSLPEAKRRGVDLENFGLDFMADDSWNAVVRQVDLLADRDELSRLKKAPPSDRAEQWARFWSKRDPDLTTPENERLREHFRRVEHSRRNYSDGFRDGALSDRGRVFVLHGAPDAVRTSGSQFDNSAAWEIWSYSDLNLIYYFQLVYGANYRLVWREEA